MMRKLPDSLYLGHASYVCSTVMSVCVGGGGGGVAWGNNKKNDRLTRRIIQRAAVVTFIGD